MKVLIACEESQAVCKEFRKLGHESYSCDIIPCSGGHPEWHIMSDVLPLLNGNCDFRTESGGHYNINGRWDMIIAFPPCTYFTCAGNRHYSSRENAVSFFLAIANADCDKIAIENPVGNMNIHWRKPDQIIHPYYFAESEKDTNNYYQKRTCLWLKNLPELHRITNLQKPRTVYICQGSKFAGRPIGWCEGIKGIHGGQEERAKARSTPSPGIAKAMAEQWGTERR